MTDTIANAVGGGTIALAVLAILIRVYGWWIVGAISGVVIGLPAITSWHDMPASVCEPYSCREIRVVIALMSLACFYFAATERSDRANK